MFRVRSEALAKNANGFVKAQFREKEVLDDRIRRVAEPVGIDALLKRLSINLLLGLARPSLKFGIDGKFHDAPPLFPGRMAMLSRVCPRRQNISQLK